MNVDDGLEDIRWIRGLGGEKLPAASNALLSNLKKGLFFAIGEGSRFFVACFLHSSAQTCLYQKPGRRPPPTTRRFVNTVTREWVGAPNGRAPFRFHGAVVVIADRCMFRTQNLAALNKHLARIATSFCLHVVKNFTSSRFVTNTSIKSTWRKVHVS